MKSSSTALYDHPCEYCDGQVRLKVLDNEILRVGKDGYVILETVPVGVCDHCGMRYYHSSVLKRAGDAYRTGGSSSRKVPVAPFQKA